MVVEDGGKGTVVTAGGLREQCGKEWGGWEEWSLQTRGDCGRRIE